MFNNIALKTISLSICFIMLLATLQCANRSAPAPDLPKDILGVSVGMDKKEAQNHLKEIGKLLREEAKHQEVWVLKDNSHFGHLAVGYNEENRVRYVAAIAKPDGKTPMKPSEIGSLTDAKQEINGPNYRYIWQVVARENKPAYSITAQGNQPEGLSLYTMSDLRSEDSSKEERK